MSHSIVAPRKELQPLLSFFQRFWETVPTEARDSHLYPPHHSQASFSGILQALWLMRVLASPGYCPLREDGIFGFQFPFREIAMSFLSPPGSLCFFPHLCLFPDDVSPTTSKELPLAPAWQVLTSSNILVRDMSTSVRSTDPEPCGHPGCWAKCPVLALSSSRKDAMACVV